MTAGSILWVAQKNASSTISISQLSISRYTPKITRTRGCSLQVPSLSKTLSEIYISFVSVPKVMFRSQFKDNLQQHFSLQK